MGSLDRMPSYWGTTLQRHTFINRHRPSSMSISPPRHFGIHGMVPGERSSVRLRILIVYSHSSGHCPAARHSYESVLRYVVQLAVSMRSDLSFLVLPDAAQAPTSFALKQRCAFFDSKTNAWSPAKAAKPPVLGTENAPTSSKEASIPLSA